MANHSATKKTIRKTARKTVVNRDRRNRVRTFVKKVEAFIAEGKKTEAAAALKVAEKEFMKAVTKNVFKLNTAARKISRLSKRIKAIA